MKRIRRELDFLRHRIEARIASATWEEWQAQQERWLDRVTVAVCIIAVLYFGGHLAYALWTGAL